MRLSTTDHREQDNGTVRPILDERVQWRVAPDFPDDPNAPSDLNRFELAVDFTQLV